MPAISAGRTVAQAALIALAILFLQACGRPADAQGGPPPAMPVSVAPAVQRAVTDLETAVNDLFTYRDRHSLGLMNPKGEKRSES